MSNRHALSCAFLSTTDWAQASRRPLAGDASNRRYERLSHPAQPSAVLMDAAPEKGEDVRPFVSMAHHLTGLGLSAPKIYSEDAENGFLLIEDLGDALFARLLEQTPELETDLYEAAAAALIVAQKAAPPNLALYDVATMSETALLLPDWYLEYGTTTPPTSNMRDHFARIMTETLEAHAGHGSVLVQRDYHAENLLWLHKRKGAARVGLLDFQDAMIGHPAYDLASLLKDARRDVSPAVQAKTFEYFVNRTGYDRAEFEAGYAACSAQRNIRILGVFARLCVRDGKAAYPDLMPRVWRNLQDDLTHPALAQLASWVHAHVPPPAPQLIARIKAASNG